MYIIIIVTVNGIAIMGGIEFNVSNTPGTKFRPGATSGSALHGIYFVKPASLNVEKLLRIPVSVFYG
jgi:hypothetical protein